jgi:hypothetical protein
MRQESTGPQPEGESRVPAFANEQEAARFWDMHSPLGYPDDFEEVPLIVQQASTDHEPDSN